MPGAAVTREGDQICVSGLPSGATTRITLRAGMPGEGGLTLVKDTTPQHRDGQPPPRIDFDTRMFLLPRGQAPAIGLGTVNLSAVKLTLSRLTERNVIGFVRDAEAWPAGGYPDADNIGEQSRPRRLAGQCGHPELAANRTAHTALPMPDALATAGPGLYALIARPAMAPRMRVRGADDPAHRFRAHGLARHRWADRAGARLLRCAAARQASRCGCWRENNEILGE